MAKKQTRSFAVIGALGALSIFLGITRLGIIPWFSGASITIMHLPVIIGAILEGPVVGAAIGAIFGIFSLIQAVIAPGGALDPFFVNPFVSVLPRLCIGLVAWIVYRGLTIIPKFPQLLAIALASFLGSLTNTLLVLGALAILKAITWPIFWTVTLSNGLIEAAAATIICTSIIATWKTISSRKGSRLTGTSEKSDS